MTAKSIHIVPIYRPIILEPQRLKKCAGRDRGGHGPLKTGGSFSHLLACPLEVTQQVINFIADLVEGLARGDLCKVLFQSPYDGVNRLIVVVYYHQAITFQGTRMLHRFKSHSAGHCSIPDNRYYFRVRSIQIPANGHAKPCRNRCTGVPHPERVVLTFRSFRESGESFILSVGMKNLPPAC